MLLPRPFLFCFPLTLQLCREVSEAVAESTVLLTVIQVSELSLVYHLKCLTVQTVTGLAAYAEVGGHLHD